MALRPEPLRGSWMKQRVEQKAELEPRSGLNYFSAHQHCVFPAKPETEARLLAFLRDLRRR
jgi:hypothetical protein